MSDSQAENKIQIYAPITKAMYPVERPPTSTEREYLEWASLLEHELRILICGYGTPGDDLKCECEAIITKWAPRIKEQLDLMYLDGDKRN